MKKWGRWLILFLMLDVFGLKPVLGMADLKNVRSVTYYNFPYEIGAARRFVDDFKKDIDGIQKNRFNTVWLVIFRDYFNPSKDVYSDQPYADLKQVLRELKNRNMQAILPLNYGNGPSYKTCQILTDPAAYQDFVGYVTEVLTRISDYSDMTKILIFTEGTWSCDPKSNTPEGGEKLSKQISQTLGKLPNDLPKELRSKFTIGFHDSYIGEGWNQGSSAIYDANSYDFFSSTAYAGIGQPDSYGMPVDENNPLISRIDNRVARVRKFYPTLPIFFGEVGASYCMSGSNDNTQAKQDLEMLTHLQDKGIGANVWMWKPIFAGEPDSFAKDCAFGGHAIIHSDGSLSKTAEMLKVLYKPNIESAGVNAWGDGYAVWMKGKNLDGNIRAEIYINGQLTKQNIPVTVGADVSTLSLETNLLKPYCQTGQCAIEVVLTDENGNKSDAAKVGGVDLTLRVISGDFNGDGVVDLKDFGSWKMQYLAGQKSLADYVVWKKAYLGNY